MAVNQGVGQVWVLMSVCPPAVWDKRPGVYRIPGSLSCPAFFQYPLPLLFIYPSTPFFSSGFLVLLSFLLLLLPLSAILASLVVLPPPVLGWSLRKSAAANPELVATSHWLSVPFVQSEESNDKVASQMNFVQHALPSSGLTNSGTGCHTGSLGDTVILWSWAPSWRIRNGDRSRALVQQPGARTAVAQTWG